MFKNLKILYYQHIWRQNKLAAKNKKEIIDKLEDYYNSIFTDIIYINTRDLAISDFLTAKKNGKLDKLNRIKKKGHTK